MKIRISLDLGEHDTHLFSVDTDAQKVAAMDWLTDYLDENCDGWSIGYHHGTSKEYLCYSDEATRFAIPLGQDPQFLAFYDKLVADLKSVKSTVEGPWVSKVFFSTNLDFFDLQRSLGIGAYQSAGMR